MKGKILKNNKYANFKFKTECEFEAGIVLHGSDVKDIKKGFFNIKYSYVILENGELFLVNLILESTKDNKAKRKLLLKKEEINKISRLLEDKRYHGYVLSVIYNENNLIKFRIGVGVILRKYEKKASQKRSTEKRNLELQIQKGMI